MSSEKQIEDPSSLSLEQLVLEKEKEIVLLQKMMDKQEQKIDLLK